MTPFLRDVEKLQDDINDLSAKIESTFISKDLFDVFVSEYKTSSEVISSKLEDLSKLEGQSKLEAVPDLTVPILGASVDLESYKTEINKQLDELRDEMKGSDFVKPSLNFFKYCNFWKFVKKSNYRNETNTWLLMIK